MRSLVLACLTIYSLTSFAQKHKLYGTWQSSETETLICEDSTLNTKSFYSNYRPFILIIEPDKGNRVHPPFDDPNSRLEENRVRITKKNIILKKRRDLYLRNEFEPPAYYNIRREVYRYEKVSDSELKIISNRFNYYSDTTAEAYCYNTFSLIKVKDRPYPSIAELEANYKRKIDSVMAQTIKLMKTDSSGRTVELKAGGEFKILTDVIYPNSSTLGIIEYLIDALGPTNNDTLLAHALKITDYHYNNIEGASIKKETYDISYKLNSALDKIPLSNIRSIIYSSSAREKTRRTASGFGWLSFVSGLIVAPLVSIDYKRGDFNKDIYFKTAGISLGILTVSVTITRFTQPKQYLVGKNYGRRGWTVISGSDVSSN